MTAKFKGILLSVILLVIALALLPVVISSTGELLATSGISTYTGFTPIVKLIPLLALVAVIIVAIINGMMALKSKD